MAKGQIARCAFGTVEVSSCAEGSPTERLGQGQRLQHGPSRGESAADSLSCMERVEPSDALVEDEFEEESGERRRTCLKTSTI